MDIAFGEQFFSNRLPGPALKKHIVGDHDGGPAAFFTEPRIGEQHLKAFAGVGN